MELHIACGKWIREKDEKVLDILKKVDTMPSVEELAAMTGLRPFRVEITLKMLRQQERIYAARKNAPDPPKEWEALFDAFLAELED